MDALIKALEKRGYTTTATGGYDGYTAVTIDEEEIKFDIFEFSRKIPNPNKSERLYPKRYNSWTYRETISQDSKLLRWPKNN